MFLRLRSILKFTYDVVGLIVENGIWLSGTLLADSVDLARSTCRALLPAIESTQEVVTTAIVPFVKETVIPLVPAAFDYTQFGVAVVFRVGFRIYKTVACIYFLGFTINIGYQGYSIAPRIREGFTSYFNEGASFEEACKTIFPSPKIGRTDLEISPHQYLELSSGQETTAVEKGIEYAITKIATVAGKNPLSIEPHHQARAIAIYDYTNDAFQLSDGPLLRSKGHDQILGLFGKTYEDFSLVEIKPKVVVDLYGDRILDVRTCSPETLDALVVQISSDNSCLSKAISQLYPPHTEECYKVTGNAFCTLSEEYLKQYIARGAIILPTPTVDKPPTTSSMISNILNRMMPEMPNPDGRFTENLMYHYRNVDAM